MKIQILGTGCDKCKKLAANADEAKKRLNLNCEIEKITDINKITEFGVMMTPALAIDGKVVNVGKVLSVDEICNIIKGDSCDCGGTCAITAKESKPESCGCNVDSAKSGCCGSASSSNSCCGGKFKKIITLTLLIFVIASIIFVIAKEVKSKDVSPVSTKNIVNKTAEIKNDTLVVYYFHGNQRCMTCNKIEELARQAINSKYAAELSAGTVEFKSVNVEATENEHFINDFQLSTRSVVMQKGEKYEKFDAVWTLVREPEKFTTYIQDGAAKMLENK